MSQIQKGTNYSTNPTEGIKIVTATNLNQHVSNAILLKGAITEQTNLPIDVGLSDQILIYANSLDALRRTSIENLLKATSLTDIKVGTLTGIADTDITLAPDQVVSGTEEKNKVKILSNLEVNGNIVVKPNPAVVGYDGLAFTSYGLVADTTTTSESSVVFGYDDIVHVTPVDCKSNNFHFYGSETTFEETVDPITEEERNHDVIVKGNVTVNKDLNILGAARINNSIVQSTTYIQVSNSVDEDVASGTMQGHVDVYTGASVVGQRQVSIILPAVKIRWDTNSTLVWKTKFDLVAREDGEAVEHVVARWGYNQSNNPYFNDGTRVPWQEILTPSNLDLTNKKLKLRVWAQNASSGQKTIIKTFSSFLKIKNIAKEVSDLIPTSYVSVTQTDSNNNSFTGGAPIYMTLWNDNLQ